MYPPADSSHKIFLGMFAWIMVVALLAGLVLWKRPIGAASAVSPPTPVVTQSVQQAAPTPAPEYRALLPVIHKDYLAGP